MILKAESIVKLLREGEDPNHEDPLVITPIFDLEGLENSGAASVDLRLGTWFLTLKQSRLASLQPGKKNNETNDLIVDDILGLAPPGNSDDILGFQPTKSHYVPFGSAYILHPQSFVLGVVLEWIRLPKNLGGYVTAKSSWGRRGLIIATATGIHPGFNGCLTLELSNVGEVPIAIKPGMTICQLFMHRVRGQGLNTADKSSFAVKRKPTLGVIRHDDVSEKLARANLLNRP